jgi:hypothetical protein
MDFLGIVSILNCIWALHRPAILYFAFHAVPKDADVVVLGTVSIHTCIWALHRPPILYLGYHAPPK